MVRPRNEVSMPRHFATPLLLATLLFASASTAQESGSKGGADPAVAAEDARPADEDPCAGEDPPADCEKQKDEGEEKGDAEKDDRADAEAPPAPPPSPPPPEVPAAGEEAPAPDAAEDPKEPAPRPAATAEAPEKPAPDERVEDPPETEAEATSEAAAPVEQEGLGFGGLPYALFNSDDGFAAGLLASLYWYEKGTKPYKYALTAILYFTTKLVQNHQLRFDAIDVLDLPLRVTLRGGWYQSESQNFCGFGNLVTCDPGVASAAADGLSLEGEERARFERTYYKLRFIRPYASALARWRLRDLPNRFELMVGYRAHYYHPGNPFADDDGDGAPDFALTPYPDNHYFKAFGETGQPGLASVPQIGFMLDNRDNEPAPTKGYWIEGSVRASSFLTGSTWDYVGANLTLRGYVPLIPKSKRLVLADRLVLDGTVGDLPVQEMIRIGGSWDYTALGGAEMGRGMRVQRIIGRIKVLNQTELRFDLVEHELFGQKFRWTIIGLLDAGWVGLDWTDWGGDPLKIAFGYGGGLRLAWNDNFIIRVDVAVSQEEGYSPGLYIDINNLF
jgi:hypothetical protein